MADALNLAGIERAFPEQPAQPIRELNLAGHVTGRGLQRREDVRRQDVTPDDRQIRRRLVTRRLLDQVRDPVYPWPDLWCRLDGDDAALLERGTTTIVNQVVAMQQMVDNFRDYAKTPPPSLAPLPSMRPWGEISQEDRAETDGRAIAVINSALIRLGARPIRRMADQFQTVASYL